MKYITQLLATALLLASFSVYGLDLKAAKSGGLVGEQTNGYLGVVAADAGAEVKKLVASINKKRRAKYQEIAKRNGTELSAVETLAGEKTIGKTPAGYFIQNNAGAWKKK